MKTISSKNATANKTNNKFTSILLIMATVVVLLAGVYNYSYNASKVNMSLLKAYSTSIK